MSKKFKFLIFSVLFHSYLYQFLVEGGTDWEYNISYIENLWVFARERVKIYKYGRKISLEN